MEKSIFLKDVLEQMDLKDGEGFAIPFDIEIREFSKQNGTGGKYKIYTDARLLISKPKHPKNQRNIRALELLNTKARKTPNHHENHTRNIELPNGDIKTISRLFIIKFNGKLVNP